MYIPTIVKSILDIIGELTKRDIYRLTALLGIMFYMYMSDKTGFDVVIYMVSLMLIISLVAHFVRRIIFPYLDMGVIAKKANRSAAGAGIIFAGICFIIGCLILAVGGMLS